MPPATLAHSFVAAPGATRHLLMLHGIYGRGKNWGAIARHLLARRKDWASVLVDLRMHGGSQDFTPPHTVESAAADVVALEDTVGIAPRAVLGHSFGGKVALRVAPTTVTRPLQVWVIDSTPEAREPDGAAWAMLRILRELPPDFGDRQEAVEAMQARGVAPAPAAWMATNLALEDGRYRWRLDLDAMEALLVDFFRVDLWDVVESPAAGVSIEFVKAQDSSTLSDAACERIVAAGRAHGRAHLHRVAGGHWLNTDNPEAVLRLLSERLPR